MRKLYISAAIMLLAGIVWACVARENSKLPVLAQSPILLIIGHDISKSFVNRDKISDEHLKSAVSAIQEAGVEGKIAFRIIGDKSIPDSFLTCKISKPPARLSEDCKKFTAAERARCEKEKIKIKKERDTQGAEFTARCRSEMQRPPSNETDLNTFLERCAQLSRQPLYSNYTVIIYINSDGDHDVFQDGERLRALQCPEFPRNVQIIASGWLPDKPKCGAKYNFVQTGEFFEFFPSLIK